MKNKRNVVELVLLVVGVLVAALLFDAALSVSFGAALALAVAVVVAVVAGNAATALVADRGRGVDNGPVV